MYIFWLLLKGNNAFFVIRPFVAVVFKRGCSAVDVAMQDAKLYINTASIRRAADAVLQTCYPVESEIQSR